MILKTYSQAQILKLFAYKLFSPSSIILNGAWKIFILKKNSVRRIKREPIGNPASICHIINQKSSGLPKTAWKLKQQQGRVGRNGLSAVDITLMFPQKGNPKKKSDSQERRRGDLILPRTVLDSLISDWSILCECLH